MSKDAILQLASLSLTGDARFAADVGIAMRMIRPDVMQGNCELPPWLTAHLDTCEVCGSEKVWMHKGFNDTEWSFGHVTSSGMGWHGCLNCVDIASERL